VRERYAAWLDGVEADVAVVEIPLLYETGADALFDAVVVITAPDEIRVARSGEVVAERSSRLISDVVKAGRADFAYVNDSSIESLEAFVQAVLARLRTDIESDT
jgi:dephospho-CoA kinase